MDVFKASLRSLEASVSGLSGLKILLLSDVDVLNSIRMAVGWSDQPLNALEICHLDLLASPREPVPELKAVVIARPTPVRQRTAAESSTL